MGRLLINWLAFVLFPIGLLSQEGSVLLQLLDQNNQPVPNADVIVNDNLYYVTNEEGQVALYSSFPLALSIRHVSYDILDTLVSNTSNNKLELRLNNRKLSEVTISEKRFVINRSINGSLQISREFIESLPSILGSSNFTQALKSQPGVQTSYDFSSGFLVRGGDLDQNHVLIDNVAVYNLNHVGGIFPIINNEIIKSINFFSGPIPSNYGGRLSSYTVLETRIPDLQKVNSKFRIGLLDADYTIDIPIIKSKLSLFSSNRFVHFFPLTLGSTILYKSKLIPNSINLGFYDSYNKIYYQPSSKVKLTLMNYFNKDIYRVKSKELQTEQDDEVSWGNSVISLAGQYKVGKVSFIKSSLSLSQYKRVNEMTTSNNSSVNSFNNTGLIKDVSFTLTSDNLTNKGRILSGISYTKRVIRPSDLKSISSDGVLFLSGDTLGLNNFATFANLMLNVSNNLSLDIGMRFNLDMGKAFRYFNAEPRLNVTYFLNKNFSVSSSYTRASQSTFQVGGGIAGVNNEYWIQVDNSIKPQNVDIISIGSTVKRTSFNSSNSIFFKRYNNLIDAQIGLISFKSHREIIDELHFNTKGLSYGFEHSFDYKINKLSILTSYTYSRSKRWNEEIFDGKKYYATFDRPHVIVLVPQYNICSKWNFNANFIYQSGMRYSKPVGYVLNLSNSLTPLYNERNNAQYEPYHRLDLGFVRSWTSKKNRDKKLWLSLINVYNRKNISFVNSELKNDKLIINKVTLMPIFPSIAYSVVF
jgi:hypothetical protein